MIRLRSLGLTVVFAASLAACGGGDDNDKPNFSSMVSFGDSLSDVGSYATPALAASTGGGKYTVNGATSKNWTEVLAADLDLPAPCAAQTGLESSGPLAGLAQAKVDHADCYGYAQGGARVTNPVGLGNKALIALGDTSGYVGQLTDPIINQMTRHLAASGGSFKSGELVTVMAGANDLFMTLAAVQAGGATSDQALVAMGTAGAELAAYVKSLVVAKGARHVVVVNLPDVSKTPLGVAAGPASQASIAGLASTFNIKLAEGLVGVDEVLIVDGFAALGNYASNPAAFGISNVTTPACDLTKTIFASSLVCSAATLRAGDVSAYLFADTVHPGPIGYKLIADLVKQSMSKRGWI